MRKLVWLALVLTATCSALAGLSSGGLSSVVVVALSEPKSVASGLVMPADFVSVPIRLISDQKETALAYDESRQALELIVRKAKESNRFRTVTGVVTLSQHVKGFGISSGGWSQPAARAEVYLLVPLAKEGDSIFRAGAEGARFVEGLRLPGKVRYELGNLQLAVENPEQYRPKLLGLLAQEIKNTQAALHTEAGIRIEGLQSPVLVRQTDDRQVELFLNYSFSLTSQ